MTTRTCHGHDEDCWFSDLDDQGCYGRFAAFVYGELRPMYGVAVPA